MKPWYKQKIAIPLYIILGILFLYGVNYNMETTAIHNKMGMNNTIVIPAYTEYESHMLNDCLVVEVITSNLDTNSRDTITNDVIDKHSWTQMIRVFFYDIGRIPHTDIPIHREERNSYDGRNVSY